MKTITVTIDKKGKVSMEANGFVGTSCANATAKFSSLLGKVVNEEKKEEYHQQDVSNFITE
jgi:hypothetical protein